jgi:hypothetical protein
MGAGGSTLSEDTVKSLITKETKNLANRSDLDAYLKSGDASSTYLTQTNAGTTYLAKESDKMGVNNSDKTITDKWVSPKWVDNNYLSKSGVANVDDRTANDKWISPLWFEQQKVGDATGLDNKTRWVTPEYLKSKIDNYLQIGGNDPTAIAANLQSNSQFSGLVSGNLRDSDIFKSGIAGELTLDKNKKFADDISKNLGESTEGYARNFRTIVSSNLGENSSFHTGIVNNISTHGGFLSSMTNILNQTSGSGKIVRDNIADSIGLNRTFGNLVGDFLDTNTFFATNVLARINEGTVGSTFKDAVADRLKTDGVFRNSIKGDKGESGTFDMTTAERELWGGGTAGNTAGTLAGSKVMWCADGNVCKVPTMRGGIEFTTGDQVIRGFRQNANSPRVVKVDGHIEMNNSQVLQAKNSSGTTEGVLWPRWSDNKTYFNYGSAGLVVRNNNSQVAMEIDNNRDMNVNGKISATGDISGGFFRVEKLNTSTANMQFMNKDPSNVTVNGLIGADGFGFTGNHGVTVATWSNHPVRFFTNQQERLRILPTGEIQILAANGNSKGTTHFNHSSGKNFIRGDTQIDGAITASDGLISVSGSEFVGGTANISNTYKLFTPSKPHGLLTLRWGNGRALYYFNWLPNVTSQTIDPIVNNNNIDVYYQGNDINLRNKHSSGITFRWSVIYFD